jgi:transketolase
MLMYSLLHLSGYDLSLDDLKNFRQWGSPTAGHPEFGHCPGVETTTGPLGQGVGNAVGMAIAERYLAAKFNRPGHAIVDHRTFVFASDGDLMEGVAQEAASLAGHLALGKLVVLWDNNKITIEGSTDLAFTEDVGKIFEAKGWRVLKVEDGEDLVALQAAFERGVHGDHRPTLIDCRTIIGFPAPTKQNTHHAHGAPLGHDEVAATKTILGWDPESKFHIPAEALDHWRVAREIGAGREAEWQARFEAYRAAHPALAAELAQWMSGEAGAFEAALPAFTAADKLATREASGKVLNALAAAVPGLIGGSADLAGSNNSDIKGAGDFSATENGRNFHFGIREHGMGAILNGMALHGGLRPYGATFLQFADYMRGAIRLAALMGLPVIYIFTHDSIGLGEDGPTHQPVEHLASLRAIPNLDVLRPCDAAETAQAWTAALRRTDGPTALILSRQKLPTVSEGQAAGLLRGAYILADAEGAKVQLVATGSEVALALEARKALAAEGIAARVVSMPSWERFAALPRAERDAVLDPAVRTLSVEAGSTFGWAAWADAHVGLDTFGASAPAEVLFEKFGFSVANVVARAKELITI